MKPAARRGDRARTDNNQCEGGATEGSDTVTINGLPALRMCDHGVGDSGTCVSKDWEAVTGSATVSANGRPLVRLDDTTQHFDSGLGKMTTGSPNVLIGGPSAQPEQVSVDELARYIYDEMMRNIQSDGVAEINEYMSRFNASLTPSPFSGMYGAQPMPDMYSLFMAFLTWKDLVGTGAAWDHKTYILDNYGRWAYDADSGTSFSYETWSNIHYGFVGRAAGLGEGDLLGGAGLAQYLDHEDPNLLEQIGAGGQFVMGGAAELDEPEDQEGIRIGFRLWDRYEMYGEITFEDVRAEVLASTGLKTIMGFTC